MKEHPMKQGGGGFNVPIVNRFPQRKPHSAMSTQELVDKANKKAGVVHETPKKQLKRVLKKLK